MTIKKAATPADAMAVAQLAAQLWSHPAPEELAEDFALMLSDDNNAVFLCCVDEQPAGFAHVSLRHDYVEGTESSPVGFLEGVFVPEIFRCRGIASDLLCACENWARAKGCTEFASDCELVNEDSIAFHGKLGFEEVNRIVCFRKDLY